MDERAEASPAQQPQEQRASPPPLAVVSTDLSSPVYATLLAPPPPRTTLQLDVSSPQGGAALAVPMLSAGGLSSISLRTPAARTAAGVEGDAAAARAYVAAEATPVNAVPASCSSVTFAATAEQQPHSPLLADASPPTSPEFISPALYAMHQQQQQRQAQAVTPAGIDTGQPSPASQLSPSQKFAGIKARLARASATMMLSPSSAQRAAASVGEGSAYFPSSRSPMQPTANNSNAGMAPPSSQAASLENAATMLLGRQRSPTLGSLSAYSPQAAAAAANATLLNLRRPSQLQVLSPDHMRAAAATGGGGFPLSVRFDSIGGAPAGPLSTTHRGHSRRPSTMHRRAPSLALFTPSTQQLSQQPHPPSSMLQRRSSVGPMTVSHMAAMSAANASQQPGMPMTSRGSMSSFLQHPALSLMRRPSITVAAGSSNVGSPSVQQLQQQQQQQEQQAQSAAQANPYFNPAYSQPTQHLTRRFLSLDDAGGNDLAALVAAWRADKGLDADTNGGDDAADAERMVAEAVRDVLESGEVVDLGGGGTSGSSFDAALLTRLRAEEALRALRTERVFFLIFLLSLMSSLDQGIVAAALLNLRADIVGFSGSFARLGLLGSLNFLGLIAGGFLAGPVLERGEQRLVVGVALGLQSLCVFLVGAVAHAPLMLLCRFLTGIFQAPLVVFAPAWVAAHAQTAALGAPDPTGAATANLTASWLSMLHVSNPLAVALGFLIGVVACVQDEEASSGTGHVAALGGGSTGASSSRPWKWAFLAQAFTLLPLAVILLLFVPRALFSTKERDLKEARRGSRGTSSAHTAASVAAMMRVRAMALREYEAALRREQQEHHQQQQQQQQNLHEHPSLDSATAAAGRALAHASQPPLNLAHMNVSTPSQLQQTPFPSSAHASLGSVSLGSARFQPGSGWSSVRGNGVGSSEWAGGSHPVSTSSSAGGAGGVPWTLRHITPGSMPGAGGTMFSRGVSDGSVALAPSSTSFVSPMPNASPSSTMGGLSDGIEVGGMSPAAGGWGSSSSQQPLPPGFGMSDAEWRALEEHAAAAEAAAAREDDPNRPPLVDSLDFSSMFSPRHRVVTWSWSPRGTHLAADAPSYATVSLGASEPTVPVELPSMLGRVWQGIAELGMQLWMLLHHGLFLSLVLALSCAHFLLTALHFWLVPTLVASFPSLHLSGAGLAYILVAFASTPLGVGLGHASMRFVERRIDAGFDRAEAIRIKLERAAREADQEQQDEEDDGSTTAVRRRTHVPAQQLLTLDTEGRKSRVLSKHVFVLVASLSGLLALWCLLLAVNLGASSAAGALVCVFLLLLTGGALVPCASWLLEGAMWSAGSAIVAEAAAAENASTHTEQPDAEALVGFAHAFAQLCFNFLGYFLAPVLVGAMMDSCSAAAPGASSDLARGLACGDLLWCAPLAACVALAGVMQWRQCERDREAEDVARAVYLTTGSFGAASYARGGGEPAPASFRPASSISDIDERARGHYSRPSVAGAPGSRSTRASVATSARAASSSSFAASSSDASRGRSRSSDPSLTSVVAHGADDDEALLESGGSGRGDAPPSWSRRGSVISVEATNTTGGAGGDSTVHTAAGMGGNRGGRMDLQPVSIGHISSTASSFRYTPDAPPLRTQMSLRRTSEDSPMAYGTASPALAPRADEEELEEDDDFMLYGRAMQDE